jgi:hypothetical protein
VGRAVSISAGERDFESSDGQNVLKGKIAAVRADPDAPHGQEVRLAVTPFAAGTGHTIERQVAKANYRDEVGIVEHLARGEDARLSLSSPSTPVTASTSPPGR